MNYGVKCPKCESVDSRVIDSRDVQVGVRRRRECLTCSERFTTFEVVRERFAEVSFNFNELQQMTDKIEQMQERIKELSVALVIRRNVTRKRGRPLDERFVTEN